jgi:Membrane protein of unknown function (DUF340).
MLSLLLTLALGLFCGFLWRKRSLKGLSTGITVVICVLLFYLGVELGGERAVLAAWDSLGLMAILITLGALAGSVLAAAFIYKKFFA